MFLSIKDFDTEQIKAVLYERLANKPTHEMNFVMSHDSSMACFVDDLFFITDDYFVPRLIYKPLSIINSCAISDDCTIAICQTANNHENNDDSGVFALIDVNNQKLIGKSRLVTGWKYLSHLFVDSKNKVFYCYYDDIKVAYNFNFQPVNETQVALYRKQFDYENKKDIDIRPQWEKELDNENKKRAGINEDTIKCDWLWNKKTSEERQKYFKSDYRWMLFESGVIKNDADLERLYKTVSTEKGTRKTFKSENELKSEGIILKEENISTVDKVKDAVTRALNMIKE